ncbi:hypothetical protein [Okeania sp. KiyG1]|uniref:hypothetical protein n=1 Tax=Okeania sp. KiyG1 TaxID=2720165 RepID=UPI00198A0827|nr:hypothetical protein [Okeania sp. KiyG1]GFZ95936.1 hypothetical protein CYANOKiyG1_07030 [Okeania sp. KiyG1]
MRIIKTTGTMKNGEVKITVSPEFDNGEVDIILIAKNEPDEFEIMREIAKAKGYDSQEKILDLIKKVKLEMLQEKDRIK